MKKLGYYPALVFLLLLCAALSGVFIYLGSTVVKRMGKFKSSDETYKASVEQLKQEEATLNNNQKADKAYADYFTRWVKKEGEMDEAKLRQKLQKSAEEMGLSVYDIVPLGAPTSDKDKTAPAKRKNLLDKMMEPKARPPLPGVIPGMPGGAAENEMIELRVTVSGSFSQLMAWLGKAEGEMGSLRVVQTEWTARAPDEVRLTAGVRYKMMGEMKPEGQPKKPEDKK